MSWAADELAGVELGDARLNKRVVTLLDRFAAHPTASIPGVCGDWAETQAAYRFLANETVSWEAILSAHWTSTRARMGAHAVVLCLQDTTELDFNGRSTEGLGRSAARPLTHEARRGLYLHPTYAVSLGREPLGVLDAWMWAREARDEHGERGGVRESLRWSEGYERLAELAVELPRGGPPETRLVYVADREADIVELMATARDLDTPVDWLVRARHNRALPEGDKLRQRVGAGAVLGEVCFTLPARHGCKARAVRQRVRAVSVVLSDRQGGRVSASCIIAKEVGAPAGIKPLEWRLLSNREALTFEAACQLIDWYRVRWEIELFFHVLKNGCRTVRRAVEALQLGTIERVERALALYLVVAWRVARLMRLGHSCPELNAELLFDRDEWQAAFILNKRPPPPTPPPLNEVIRLIARLGGFLARKHDGTPGVKTIWLGVCNGSWISPPGSSSPGSWTRRELCVMKYANVEAINLGIGDKTSTYLDADSGRAYWFEDKGFRNASL